MLIETGTTASCSVGARLKLKNYLHSFIVLRTQLSSLPLSTMIAVTIFCLTTFCDVSFAYAQCLQFTSNNGASLTVSLRGLSAPTITDFHNGYRGFSYSAKESGSVANLTIGQASVTGTDVDVYIDITSSLIDPIPTDPTPDNTGVDGAGTPAPSSNRTEFTIKLMPTSSPRPTTTSPSAFYAVIHLVSTSILLPNGLSESLPAASAWDYKTGFYGLIQAPSPAATGPFDSMNPPSVISIGTNCPAIISPQNCATNTVVDLNKVHVTPSSVWSNSVRDGQLSVEPGYYFVPLSFGISITVDPDAVTNTGPSPPPSETVYYKFIQNLDTFTGYSLYQDDAGNSQQEWGAVLAPLGTNVSELSGPLVDYTPENPPYYSKYQGVNDSPVVHAPLRNAKGRSLSVMHYTKTFTAYYGCHTPKDLIDYPSTDSRHYLHTLAKITWGVNYFGKVSLCILSCQFTSDTSIGPINTRNGPGVFFDPPEQLSDTVIVVSPPTSNGNTNYLCSMNVVCR